VIVIVDYNAGNLRSILKAIEIYAGRENVKVSKDPEEVLSGDSISRCRKLQKCYIKPV